MKRICGAIIAAGGAVLLGAVYARPIGMRRIEAKVYGLIGLMAAAMGIAILIRFRRQA